MTIELADMLEFDNPKDYKVHLASWNESFNLSEVSDEFGAARRQAISRTS